MTGRQRALLLSLAAVGAAGLVVARRRSVRDRLRLEPLWTRVAGCWIHTRVASGPGGEALPVVLVHGYGVSGSYMAPLARQLAAELPVFVPDLPGHGRSGKPDRAFDVPGLAEVLHEWMETVGLGRAAFVANSMGCQIVAELAVRHPELVDRLVLIGPTADAGARTVRQQVWRVLRVALEERPSLIPLVIADYLRAGPGRLVEELRAMLDHRIERSLPRIAAPALVVRGEDDHISPQPWAEEVSSLLGTGRVLVVDDAGHALNYSDPDELAKLIRPFLLGITDPSAAKPAVSRDSR